MALVRTNRRTAGVSSVGAETWTDSTSFTPSNDSLLVCGVMLVSNFLLTTETQVSVSGGGLTWVPEVGRFDASESSDRALRIFTAEVVGTAPSVTITVDSPGADITVLAISVVEYTGHDTTTSVTATASKAGMATDGSDTLTLSATPAAGDEVFMMLTGVTFSNADPLMTAGTGYTNIHSPGIGEVYRSATQVRDPGSTSTTYTIADVAADSAWISAFSFAVAINIAEASAPSAPGQVTGLTVTNTRPTRLDLSWSAPSANGSAITDYIIERAPDVSGSPGSWSTVTDGTSTSTTYTDTGLTNLATYWYRVSAVNGIGTGTVSSSVSAFVFRNPMYVTSSTEVGTSLGSSNSIPNPSGSTTGDLIIHAAAHDNPPISLDGSTGWTAYTQMTYTTAVTGRVFARQLDGTGDDSFALTGASSQDYAVISIRIPAGEHGGVTSIQFLGFVHAISTNAIDPPLLQTYFDDWLWIAGAIADMNNAARDITSDPITYTNIANIKSAASTTSVGIRMAYKRASTFADDPSTFAYNNTEEAVAFTMAIPPAVDLPQAPTITYTGAYDGAVGLRWSTGDTNGRYIYSPSVITDYVIQWAVDSGTPSWNTFSDGTSTATETTVTGLSNGTDYIFRVAAVNSAGTGGYSSATAPVTPGGASLATADGDNILLSDGSGGITRPT